jgi:hypothetical protein
MDYHQLNSMFFCWQFFFRKWTKKKKKKTSVIFMDFPPIFLNKIIKLVTLKPRHFLGHDF